MGGRVGHRNILVVGCGKAKDRRPGLMPAQERYLGPFWRQVRKAVHVGSLRVLVLSAEFGLIDGATPIPDYDTVMTPDRQAAILADPRNREFCAEVFGPLDGEVGSVYAAAGEAYLTVLDGLCPELWEYQFAEGDLLGKRRALGRWLAGELRYTGEDAVARPAAA